MIIADDHAGYREGLVRAVQSDDRLELIAEADDGLEAAGLARLLQPDVLLLDVRMPGQGGMELCRAITANPPHPRFRVVLITASPGDDFDARAREVGAAAGVGKETPRAELMQLLRGDGPAVVD